MSDDKISEIRERHSDRTEIDQSGGYRLNGFTYHGSLSQSQDDLATALAEVERLRSENARLRAENEKLREEIEYLRKAHQTAIEWANLYRADNIRMRYEIERLEEDGR